MQPSDPTSNQNQPSPPDPYAPPAASPDQSAGVQAESPVPPVNPTPVHPIEGSTEPKVHNPLAAMRPGEKIICEIKRHPIGLFNIYIGTGILLLLVAVVGYGVAPSVFTGYSKTQVYGVCTIILLIVAAICLLFLFVAHLVYTGNSWIVTSDSVTQVIQNSLFSKQSSQLSMANLEDITAEQNGILPHMFNYGVLKAETAGERSKFRFIYCPNPNYYAQCILQAREAFEQDNYRVAAAPQPYQQPQSPQQPTYPTNS